MWKEYVICFTITELHSDSALVSVMLVKVCGGNLPDVTDDDYCGNFTDTTISPRPPWKPQLAQGRWRRALHPFRPRKERIKSREHTEAAGLSPPSITVSSPDLVSFTSLKLY
jgi:hypothetical protein